ncbi:hypothetical protein Q4485_14870 [Granulosicoccaceae sp. 1_MG-2023]|nr:hypothetical protein [Granulosicoccaceae sp. 1_MG-2023]
MPVKKQARHRLASRLPALALCGLLALCYPLILLPSQPLLIGGIPLLYLYLFAVWLLLIIVTARTIRALHRSDGGE